MIAFITVEKVNKDEVDYMHFNDKSQKAWNCKNADLFSMFYPGNRIKVDFNMTKPSDPKKKPSRYINNARPAQQGDPAVNGVYEDGVLTDRWDDKEPYTGNRGGGKVSKDNYDPEVGKRQTAANVAGNILSHMAGDMTLNDVVTSFPQIADEVYNWINQKPVDSFRGSSSESVPDAGGQEDIPF